MKKFSKTLVLVLLAALLIATLFGCSAKPSDILGNWTEVNYGVSYTFNEDGTAQVNGTTVYYTFDGKTLSFMPEEGADATEVYTVQMSGDSLKMTDANGNYSQLKKA